MLTTLIASFIVLTAITKILVHEERIYIGEISAQLPSPPCVQVHNCIEKYAEEYKIPIRYAYGVAYQETRYSGPLDWNYDHVQTSSAGAVGPMQIMYQTARMLFPDKNFSKEDLKNDIDFNVHCSMKLLRRLHDKYGNWKLAFGAYNTGRPLVNQYAENVYRFTIKNDKTGRTLQSFQKSSSKRK